VTSLEVIDAFISRIKEVNPLLNAAVANRFEDARQEAAEFDRILDSGDIPPELSAENAPYLGVPVTAKEAISVAGNVHILNACFMVCMAWYFLRFVWPNGYEAHDLF